MPTYCYITKDEEVVDRIFSMGDAPCEVVLDDGRVAERSFQAEHGGYRRPINDDCWPMKPCYASGVNASQASELREYLAKRGCPTEVSPDGDPVYTSASHRRRALKLRGIHDKASYE